MTTWQQRIYQINNKKGLYITCLWNASMSSFSSLTNMEGFKLFPTADAHEHDNDTHSEANKPGEEIADMITY